MEEKRVILVDDGDIDTLAVARLALERRGFSVFTFTNEKDAFDRIITTNPHVVFVHLSEEMKRSTDFIARIHDADPMISIIYYTAYSGRSAHDRAILAGAFTTLHKPLAVDEIIVSANAAYHESVRKRHNSFNERSVFVLMPFDEKFTKIYNSGIKEPLESCGYLCNRADEIQFTGNIMDKVYDQIRNAGLIIADTTGKNPNVFYEIGYAHAMGKIVILLTQDVETIPFDLRSQKHIIYGRNLKKLRSELLSTVEFLKRVWLL